MEYYDGFFTFNKKTVPYERITDINLNKSLFDRIFGVGTIKINTAGSSLISEINIRYIRNPENIFEEINREVKKESGRN